MSNAAFSVESMGDTARRRCVELAVSVSGWQKVIHGSERDARGRLAAAIYDVQGGDAAMRFSLCGRGDKIMRGGGQTRVKPCKCGSRFCARCSRYKGLSHAKRAKAHLSAREHGHVSHVVLTQRVRKAETWREAVKRWDRTWRQFWRQVKRRGDVVGGLLTIHVTWSRFGGWHAHGHLLSETNGAPDGRAWDEFWTLARRRTGDDGELEPLFIRQVCEPGPALVFGKGEGDLWTEGQDQVANALEYPLRDVVSGVRNEQLHEVPADRLLEWVGGAKGVQMHRRLGAWVKPVAVEDDGEGTSTDGEAAVVVEREMGTVDDVIARARAGQREAVLLLRELEACCRNDGVVAKRLVAIVRWAIGG